MRHECGSYGTSLLFVTTSFAVITLVVLVNNGPNGLSLFSLPSSYHSDQTQRGSVDDKLGVTRTKKRDDNLKKVEAGLARARALIKDAMTNHSRPSSTEDPNLYVPEGDIYRDANVFHRYFEFDLACPHHKVVEQTLNRNAMEFTSRSYQLMEKMFKIYVYEEGEPPIFHNGPCKDIYSMEGIFINLMEKNTQFRTRDPNKAHVYYLSFSVVMILHTLFDPVIRDKAVLGRTVGGYVSLISTKYPYWNRSLGADHFMLSCHDWGPRATWYVPQLYFTSIRVLCNANISERFNPKKDASFPEINLKTGQITNLTGGLAPENRTILAFFAGNPHGKIRPSLFEHWLEKDDQILVYKSVPEGKSYKEMMKKSRFCICPSGWEVASPRIVEAIYLECVPVLISQNYVLPFSDVLDWDSFSVRVLVEEIRNLKEILTGISEEKYLKMQKNVKKVQRHFLINDPPKRYDVFHMILHSIWLRRLNVLV